METKYIIIIVVSVLFLILLLIWLIPYLNVRSSLKKLDAQLKRRCEILPPFMEMVYDSVLQGQSTLAAVTTLREEISKMTPNQEYFTKNATLSDEIARLMFTVNNYPELKIKENFESMHNELNTLETTIEEKRKKYNEKVKAYNSKMIKLPYKLFRVKLKDLYETKYDRFENKY